MPLASSRPASATAAAGPSLQPLSNAILNLPVSPPQSSLGAKVRLPALRHARDARVAPAQSQGAIRLVARYAAFLAASTDLAGEHRRDGSATPSPGGDNLRWSCDRSPAAPVSAFLFWACAFRGSTVALYSPWGHSSSAASGA